MDTYHHQYCISEGERAPLCSAAPPHHYALRFEPKKTRHDLYKRGKFETISTTSIAARGRVTELIDGPRPKGVVGAEDGDLLGCMSGLSNACVLLPFPSALQIDVKHVSLSIGSAPVALWFVFMSLAGPFPFHIEALPSRGGDYSQPSPSCAFPLYPCVPMTHNLPILPGTFIRVRGPFLVT